MLVTGSENICCTHVGHDFWLPLSITILARSVLQGSCGLVISAEAVSNGTTLFEQAYNDAEVGGVKAGALGLSVECVVKSVTALGDAPGAE